MADYELNILSNNDQLSVDMITPNKQHYSLNLKDILPAAFSFTPIAAIWRVQTDSAGETPYALIIRLETVSRLQNNSDQSLKIPYLIISKISEKKICAIHYIKAESTNALLMAEKIADSSVNGQYPCLNGVNLH